MFSGLNSIWVADFEFHQPDGELPQPICMMARELFSGRRVSLWRDELLRMSAPPFSAGDGTLFVAYFASAEIGCYLSLGWPVPLRILDPYVEFRALTNGLSTPCGNGLLGAMAYHGLDTMLAVDKAEMRNLAARGGPYTENEGLQLLQYCERDVDATTRLLQAMASRIDLPRALLRGRYMAAVARMERTGIPIDDGLLQRLRQYWSPIQRRLIAQIDSSYGVYEGNSFRSELFGQWLQEQNIPWPRTERGALSLSDDTFREMSKSYPQVAPLRELRHALGSLRLEELTVGADGRNRCLLSPFSSRTSRNQPSNAKFIFGPAVWLRSLIKPKPGRAIAYVDYSQQEFAVAAALSKDVAMMEAYSSGDPYLRFAQQAGAAPPGATKASHQDIRDQFKICALAVQYGMGSGSLSQRINKPEAQARELLQFHRQTYPRYWGWSEAALTRAMLHEDLHTCFGWPIHVGPSANPRSLRNFPVQANGAEILRLACCLATEAGIAVCAPVHDALLVEADDGAIDAVVAAVNEYMVEAGRIVLEGFALRTDAKIVRFPDRYCDDRGRRMWTCVMELLSECKREQGPGVETARQHAASNR